MRGCEKPPAEQTQGTQQTTQTAEAAGNLCEVLSHLVRKKISNLRLISKVKEFHKMQYLKIVKRWPKFKSWWTRYELVTIPNRSLPIWVRQENPTDSAKNRVVQVKNLEYRIVWVGYIPNRSMSRVLETRIWRIDLLLLWCVFFILARTESENWKLSLRLWLFFVISCGVIGQEVKDTVKANGKTTISKRDAKKGAR